MRTNLGAISLQKCRGFSIQGLLRVHIVTKELNETINDSVHIQHGTPVLPQYVQTHSTFAFQYVVSKVIGYT